MNGILSRLRNSDDSIRALDLSTRDDTEFYSIIPEGTIPDSRNLPQEWCTALANNHHVRELCLYASFLDTVDQNPARHSRFAVLMELFSHLHSLEELEIHAFSVPTRNFPVLPLSNLLRRQALSLRKLALFNIRSEGILSHAEGFRDELAQAISSMTYLEELIWEPFPLLESQNNRQMTQEDNNAQRAIDEALMSAIVGLPRLRKLSLCSRSVNVMSHPLQRLPLSRRCLGEQWKESGLESIHIAGYSLTSDDLRVLLGISKRRPTPERQLKELHLTQCLLEEPAALLEYLKVNRSLRRLVLSDTLMGYRNVDFPQDENDPYQQRDFLQQVTRILEWDNTSLHWVTTNNPSGDEETSCQRTLDTLLHLNRSGLRNISLRPELQFTCPQKMWPELLHKLGSTSPTVLADLLQRNFESLFIHKAAPEGKKR